jgi:hypothetical protein
MQSNEKTDENDLDVQLYLDSWPMTLSCSSTKMHLHGKIERFNYTDKRWDRSNDISQF